MTYAAFWVGNHFASNMNVSVFTLLGRAKGSPFYVHAIGRHASAKPMLVCFRDVEMAKDVERRLAALDAADFQAFQIYMTDGKTLRWPLQTMRDDANVDAPLQVLRQDMLSVRLQCCLNDCDIALFERVEDGNLVFLGSNIPVDACVSCA